jgi:hypothetical protein
MAGRSLVLPVSVGVVGLALIGFGQAVPNRHSIENDLTARSTKALQTADLTGLTVSFSGRDATITGTGPADVANRAESVVSAVDGVRVADAQLSSGDPAPPATPAPTPVAVATPSVTPTPEPTPTPAPTQAAAIPIGFTLADGTITVTGTVQSQASGQALINATKAAGHGWKVVDKLGVNTSLAAPAPKANRLPALTRLLAKAPVGGTKLVIQYNHDTVILRGTPATSKIEFSLLNAAATTVSGKSKVTDGLDVP